MAFRACVSGTAHRLREALREGTELDDELRKKVRDACPSFALELRARVLGEMMEKDGPELKTRWHLCRRGHPPSCEVVAKRLESTDAVAATAVRQWAREADNRNEEEQR